MAAFYRFSTRKFENGGEETCSVKMFSAPFQQLFSEFSITNNSFLLGIYLLPIFLLVSCDLFIPRLVRTINHIRSCLVVVS